MSASPRSKQPPSPQSNGERGTNETNDAVAGPSHQIPTDVNHVLTSRPGQLEISGREITVEEEDGISNAQTNDLPNDPDLLVGETRSSMTDNDSSNEEEDDDDDDALALVRAGFLGHQEPRGEPQDQQEPPPAAEEEVGFGILKTVFTYESQHLAKGSIALMGLAWIWLYSPANPVLSFFCGCLFLYAAVYISLTKSELRVRTFSGSIELCILQLTAIMYLCYFMDLLLTMFIGQSTFFPLPTRNSAVFKDRVEKVRNFGFEDFFYKEGAGLWFRVNSQFFLVSFSTLLLINIPMTLHRAAKNHVVREVLEFELFANLIPVANIAAPFLLMNVLAAWLIPAPYLSSSILWIFLHILATGWIVMTVMGVTRYPEIPLVRPLGLRGYEYMLLITFLEVLIGALFTEFILLSRSVYFHYLPGAYEQSNSEPGFVLGPHLYFNQMTQDKDPATWKYNHPYPVTYEFIQGIFVWVSLFRICRLFSIMDGITTRLDDAVREREEFLAEH